MYRSRAKRFPPLPATRGRFTGIGWTVCLVHGRNI
ncbi:hypothetical protein T01_3500 [Trichinella spiralis]|uniref:Uncharacterized protein n=1 Tax=Trichinella spiralis TaxID=6334 RepID=A0A0V0YUL5_TRISP|nr:hypothetical protein T01_3500 [Trichinella spiralis]